MELNSSELKKYSRQLILKNIGITGQKKIFNSKVLVIGAGGLGCPLILYLAYFTSFNCQLYSYSNLPLYRLTF